MEFWQRENLNLHRLEEKIKDLPFDKLTPIGRLLEARSGTEYPLLLHFSIDFYFYISQNYLKQLDQQYNQC